MESVPSEVNLSLRSRLAGLEPPKIKPAPEAARRFNSLSDLLVGLTGGAAVDYATGQTNSLPFTLANSAAYTPLTLNRVTLSYAYMTFGIIQRLINRPVLDAFKDGFVVKTSELDKDDLNLLMNELKRNRRRNRGKALGRATQSMSWQSANDFGNSDLGAVKKTIGWARLYGGAGMIINTAQDFRRELDVGAITKDSPLELIDADRWELIMSQTNIWDERNPTPFTYYGLPLHRSRVIKVLGTEAPAYIRIRLQGWGMSALECCVRSLQALLKFENVCFELLDEAKIDVYKIAGFTTSLLSPDGMARAKERILQGNRLKNYHNAVVMDMEDEYEQKKLDSIFAGLAGLWDQLRFQFCADTGFPLEVLYGVPSTGFSGGEGSIKNYNRLVETTREEAEPVLCEAVDLRSMQLFGFVPEYSIEWPELAEMTEAEQEGVKTAKQTRALDRFDRNLETGVEVMQELDKDGVMDMETEVGRGERDVDPAFMQPVDDEGGGSKASSNRPKGDAGSKAKPKPKSG